MPILILLVAFALVACEQPRRAAQEQPARAEGRPLLIDTHNDITGETLKGLDIGQPSTRTHTDIQRLRDGGVGAVFFSVYVAASYLKDNRAAHRALEMIDTVRHDIVERYPDSFQFATSADEIIAAHRGGRIAALMGLEGGHAIEDSLRLLRSFYALGIRYMTLTHSNTNNWADSSGGAKRHGGLTDFGREVVREMNRIGMIVDISHVADETFRDVLETSRAPVFASHSSCRALTPIPRNMTDDMIVAMAKKGGVIQINFGCQFVSAPSGATIDDIVAHIDHAVKIGGIDAVGIGSDFDGVQCVPKGLEDVSKFPNLTRALAAKGYSDEAIRKIYGENTLRLMRAVEKAAAAK